MAGNLPTVDEVFLAIDAYLARAYTGALPAAVGARVGQLRTSSNNIFACSAFERDWGRDHAVCG